MLYEPRVSELNGRFYVTGVSYTVILKKWEYWLIVGIDPQMARSHLYQRIQERMGSLESIASVSEVLSDVWTLLARMKNRLGGIRTPLQFFTPWNDGLFYGKVMSADVTGLNPAARAVANIWGSKDFEFPDPYATKDHKKRLVALTHTFVDANKLKPHQVQLRDQLSKYICDQRDVIDYLKLLWRIAPESDSPFTEEIFDIFNLRKPTNERMDEAMFSLEKLAESEEWQIEAEFSVRSQKRHKEHAIEKHPIRLEAETSF